MSQTLALLHDAYRELNSKKLFWITLILSGVVVLVFAAFGINERGLTFLHWQMDTKMMTSKLIPVETFYKFTFANIGVPIWLSWVATILGLISTASIFPDFIAGGSIELTLSKPISRVRLFLTKYFTGLLFAGLQVLAFTFACFLVIGIRGGSWEWSLFLAVPIVIIFFSYLYSICVLLGLITKSTIAALLLTLLTWLLFWGVNVGDALITTQREVVIVNAERMEKKVAKVEEAARAEVAKRKAEGVPIQVAGAAGNPADELEAVNFLLKGYRKEAAELAESVPLWKRVAFGMTAAKTLLPKTSETTDLLDRWLLSEKDREFFGGRHSRGEANEDTNAQLFGRPDPEVIKRVEKAFKTRPAWWVIGTSLMFEGFILAIASWIFARRDF